MRTLLILTALACLQIPLASAATVLPVGPISFGKDSDYDSNFREVAGGGYSATAIARKSGGYLQVGAASGTGSYGAAIFNTSAMGGSDGSGGTSGLGANNDLSNFTISTQIANSAGLRYAQIGFLLRLDNDDRNGYYAEVSFPSVTEVTLILRKGSGFNLSGGVSFGELISGQTITLSSPIGTSTAFYNFSVSANGNTFSLDFGNGLASTSITDNTSSATIGQVGIVMNALFIGPTGNISDPPTPTYTRLDDFSIQPVPEPQTYVLLAGSLLVLLIGSARARLRSRVRSEP